jgi:hypothetical protein
VVVCNFSNDLRFGLVLRIQPAPQTHYRLLPHHSPLLAVIWSILDFRFLSHSARLVRNFTNQKQRQLWG